MDEMKKYIIEFSEDPSTIRLIKIKNGDEFPTTEFKTVTPYTEPDLDAIRKEEYEKGVQDTKQHWGDAPRSCAYKLGYENGLNNAWEAARTLWNTPNRKEIFGNTTFNTVLTTHTAQETIEKIRQYEQGKEEQIQVGDEVDAPFGKAIVVNIDSVAKKIWVMYADGRSGFDFFKNAPTKTGRHFPEIARVLAKMKETNNG